MNPKYVVSLALAKQLKDLGFPQETDFYWGNTIGQIDQTCWRIQKKDSDTAMEWIAAPHIGEMREWLRSKEETYYTVERYAAGWFLFGQDRLEYSLMGAFGVLGNETEADATAQALIHLVKKKKINPHLFV